MIPSSTVRTIDRHAGDSRLIVISDEINLQIIVDRTGLHETRIAVRKPFFMATREPKTLQEHKEGRTWHNCTGFVDPAEEFGHATPKHKGQPSNSAMKGKRPILQIECQELVIEFE